MSPDCRRRPEPVPHLTLAHHTWYTGCGDNEPPCDHLRPPTPGQTQTDSSQRWPESPSVASLATPATSSKQAACNHPLHLVMRNFVRGDNYINDQDKQFRYKHDLIRRCHPGCYVQSVLLWRCDPVVGSGAVIGCCRAECETWHLLPPRLIGQLAPAHRGLLLGSLIMMECQGLSRY